MPPLAINVVVCAARNLDGVPQYHEQNMALDIHYDQFDLKQCSFPHYETMLQINFSNLLSTMPENIFVSLNYWSSRFVMSLQINSVGILHVAQFCGLKSFTLLFVYETIKK